MFIWSWMFMGYETLLLELTRPTLVMLLLRDRRGVGEVGDVSLGQPCWTRISAHSLLPAWRANVSAVLPCGSFDFTSLPYCWEQLSKKKTSEMCKQCNPESARVKEMIHPKRQLTHPHAIQDVDEFVTSSEQIWRNLALYHLLTNGSSVVNGCRQNESPNSW